MFVYHACTCFKIAYITYIPCLAAYKIHSVQHVKYETIRNLMYQKHITIGNLSKLESSTLQECHSIYSLTWCQ